MTTPPHSRPIRAGRVFAGIGLGLAAYVVAGIIVTVLFNVASTTTADPSAYTSNLSVLLPLLVFVGSIVVGIIQLARGDRGIGVGLLIGGAVIPIVVAGACIALIAAALRSGNL